MISRRVVFASLLCLFAQGVFAQPPAPKEPAPLWDVQIGASFVGTSGNSEQTSTGADFAAHRRGEVWKVDSAATAVRTSDHDVSTAERYLGMVRGQRMLSTLLGLSAGERLE